jgi:hypothetical protein
LVKGGHFLSEEIGRCQARGCRGAGVEICGAAFRALFGHHSNNGSFAIRQGKWKLLLTPDSGGWGFPRPGQGEADGLPRFQLYDRRLQG